MIPRPKSPAPLIGITADLSSRYCRAGRLDKEATLFLSQRYCRPVEVAGGLPLLLPPMLSKSSAKRVLDRLDGLLISGGNFDIHPSYYGEKPLPALGELKPERTEFELELVNLALARDLPLLGICGGAQAINVALGGSLYQDIATQYSGSVVHHHNPNAFDQHFHRIGFVAESRLGRLYPGLGPVRVNSIHHQAVKVLGKDLAVEALPVPDQIVEAIRWRGPSYVVGVQWHPEFHDPSDTELLDGRPLLREFLAAAEGTRSARRMPA